MDIGIDLGTTFSVIAVNGKVELAHDYPAPGFYLEECDVTIIPSPYGELTFPSAVIEDQEHPGTYLFGSDALQKAEEGFAPAMFTKRKIGTRETILMQTREMVAKDVAREFLRYLKTCAEQALGQPIARAVVTHPAYFDRGAVEETRKAAVEAGFDMSRPEQMVMEPVAAALAYTRTDKRDPLRILTYDMGGGTFDVTYLERREGVIAMRAFDGDHLLGGYNFDRELLHWIRKRLEQHGRQIVLNEESSEDRGRLARLLRLVEKVKISLAKAATETTMIDVRGRGILVDIDGKPVQINERICRSQFVKLIQRYLDRAVTCCHQAIKKAGATPEDIDEVLLVGGSTYGPWIANSLASAFANASPKLFTPDLCVGAGAAIHAKMVLPPLVRTGGYKLSLDVPEISALEKLAIAGQVVRDDGTFPDHPLQAVVRVANGDVLGPLYLDDKGIFYFEDVALEEDLPNQFTLDITNDNTLVLQHTFRVTYAPETTETSGVTTVLPRPLFIETIDGLVALAEEGVALPAKCCQTFLRTNNNRSITLKLFQERQPIGEVRIKDIPPEAGRGSYVDLEIEITEKNQIRGKASIRTPKGKVVSQTDVLVHFEMLEIPSTPELKEQFDDLAQQFFATQIRHKLLALKDKEDIQANQSEVTQIFQEIEHLLQQQPLERQEVLTALRHLESMIKPPKDEMKPTRKEFCSMVERCRAAIQKMTERSQKMLKGDNADNQEILDQKLLQKAKKNLEKADNYGPLLDRLNQEGLAAHERRDSHTWAKIYATIADIESKLRERTKHESPPTFVCKLMANFEIMRWLGCLQEKARALMNQNQWSDWQAEINCIEQELENVVNKIQSIDDMLSDEQGHAQIRKILRDDLEPLIKSIKAIGGDIKAK